MRTLGDVQSIGRAAAVIFLWMLLVGVLGIIVAFVIEGRASLQIELTGLGAGAIIGLLVGMLRVYLRELSRQH